MAKPLNFSLNLLFAVLFSSSLVNWRIVKLTNSSYVDGVLVDYLIPTIHFLDIVLLFLLVLFLCLWLLNPKAFNFKTVFKSRLTISYTLFSFFCFVCFLSSLKTQDSASLIKGFRFFTFPFLTAFVVAFKNFSDSNFKRLVYWIVFLSVVLESVLGIYQFVCGKSFIPNLFFGEPLLNFSLPGISKISFFNNAYIAPYGTFPHPNVLSFYLIFGLFVLWALDKSLFKKHLLIFVIVLLCLFLTKSYLIYFGFFGAVVLAFLKPKRVYIVLLIIGLVFVSLLPAKSFSDPSVYRRLDLNKNAFFLFKNNFFTGVGFNQFTRNIGEMPPREGEWERFIQPAHNIYLLSSAESGVFGGLLLVGFFVYILQPAKKYSIIPYFVFLCGFFDHYLITLPQGETLFLLTVLISLSTIKYEHENL